MPAECLIEVSVQAESVEELRETLQRMLAAVTPAPAATAGVTEPVQATEEEQPKPRRRRRAEEPAAEEPAPAAEELAQAPAAEEPQAEEPAAEEPAAAAPEEPKAEKPAAPGRAVTFEEVRGLLTQVQKVRKLAGVIELLAEVANERKLSDVDPRHFPAIAVRAREILAQAAAA